MQEIRDIGTHALEQTDSLTLSLTCLCRYHGNIAKDDGQQLYDEFVSLCNV